MGGERRAAAKEIAPCHAAMAVAEPGSRRFAWRKLGEIDGARARGQNAEQQAHGCYHFHFHAGLVPLLITRAVPSGL